MRFLRFVIALSLTIVQHGSKPRKIIVTPEKEACYLHHCQAGRADVFVICRRVPRENQGEDQITEEEECAGTRRGAIDGHGYRLRVRFVVTFIVRLFLYCIQSPFS